MIIAIFLIVIVSTALLFGNEFYGRGFYPSVLGSRRSSSAFARHAPCRMPTSSDRLLDRDNSPGSKNIFCSLRSPSTLPAPTRSPIVIVLELVLRA
jgi:hypothetical protein